MKNRKKIILLILSFGIVFSNPAYGGWFQDFVVLVQRYIGTIDANEALRRRSNPLLKVNLNNPEKIQEARLKIENIIEEHEETIAGLERQLKRKENKFDHTEIKIEIDLHKSALEKVKGWLHESDEAIKRADKLKYSISDDIPVDGVASSSNKAKSKLSDEEFKRFFQPISNSENINKLNEHQASKILRAFERETGAVALVGRSGGGKTYGIEALSSFMKKSSDPLFFNYRNKNVYRIDIDKLVNERDASDVSEILIDVLKNRPGFYNIDELQNFMEEHKGIYNSLKTILSEKDTKGKLSGNITNETYIEHFTDEQNIRRWTPIFVKEPDENQLRLIGYSVAKRFSEIYGIKEPEPEQFEMMLKLSFKHKKLGNPHVLVNMLNDFFIEASSDVTDGKDSVRFLQNQKLRIDGQIENYNRAKKNGDFKTLGPHIKERLEKLEKISASWENKIDAYWKIFNETDELRTERTSLIKERQGLYKQSETEGENSQPRIDDINNRLEEIASEMKKEDPLGLLANETPKKDHIERAARKTGIPEDHIYDVIKKVDEEFMTEEVLKRVPGVDKNIVQSIIRRVITQKRRLEKTTGEIPFFMVLSKNNIQAESLIRAISKVIYRSETNFFELPGNDLMNQHAGTKYWGADKGLIGSHEGSPLDNALEASNDFFKPYDF